MHLCCAGTIFKRFDPAKLFVLVGQDVTERFHLLLSLCFVVVEVRQAAATRLSLTTHHEGSPAASLRELGENLAR